MKLNDEKTIMKDMLFEIHELFSKYDIDYMLAYGTLLGGVREKGFIPWDNDADIIVKHSDYDKIKDVLLKHLPDKYELGYPEDENYDYLFYRLFPKGNNNKDTQIDIFPLIYGSEDSSLRWFESKCLYFLHRLFYFKRTKPEIGHPNSATKRFAINVIKYSTPVTSNYVKNLYLKMCTKRSSGSYYYNACGSYGIREYIPVEWFDDRTLIDFEGIKLSGTVHYHNYLSQMYGDYLKPKEW